MSSLASCQKAARCARAVAAARLIREQDQSSSNLHFLILRLAKEDVCLSWEKQQGRL